MTDRSIENTKEEKKKKHKTHSGTIKTKCTMPYTARSALTKALLHVFHLATSDFLALFISVSKLYLYLVTGRACM